MNQKIAITATHATMQYGHSAWMTTRLCTISQWMKSTPANEPISSAHHTHRGSSAPETTIAPQAATTGNVSRPITGFGNPEHRRLRRLHDRPAREHRVDRTAGDVVRVREQVELLDEQDQRDDGADQAPDEQHPPGAADGGAEVVVGLEVIEIVVGRRGGHRGLRGPAPGAARPDPRW